MRDRLVRPQVVLVRPLVPQTGDVFGDAPVFAPDNRETGFRMRVQVTHTTGKVFDSGGPGRETDNRVTCTIRRRDIPPTAPDGWEPSGNDLFELAEGHKLFVRDVQAAFPARISIRRPNGGFDGWRVTLSDRQPTMSAASQYE